jgi:hypothetical protein
MAGLFYSGVCENSLRFLQDGFSFDFLFARQGYSLRFFDFLG